MQQTVFAIPVTFGSFANKTVANVLSDVGSHLRPVIPSGQAGVGFVFPAVASAERSVRLFDDLRPNVSVGNSPYYGY